MRARINAPVSIPLVRILLAIGLTAGLVLDPGPGRAQPVQRESFDFTQSAPASPQALIDAFRAAAPAPGMVRPPIEVSALLPVTFALNSARLDPNGEQLVRILAQAINSPELGAARFGIEGHTDLSGPFDYNLRLSQDRADTVYVALIRLGVSPARLVRPVGYGPTRPIPGLDPYDPRHRRVEVVRLAY